MSKYKNSSKKFLNNLNAFCSGFSNFYKNIKDFLVIFMKAIRDKAIFEKLKINL